MSEWKEIKDHPNYLISDDGRVFSKNTNSEHSQRINKGYFTTKLCHLGKETHHRVHRLVAEAFVPNPYNKEEVNHIDGDKTNNNFNNLEWVTKKENINHAWEKGLARPSYGMKGKTNPNAGRKGKPFIIVETGDVYETAEQCAKAINGNHRHINDCLRGRQKTHRGFHFEYV